VNGADVSNQGVVIFDAGTVAEDQLNITLGNGSLAGSRSTYEFTATAYGGPQNTENAKQR
jgi:hypothetical protein